MHRFPILLGKVAFALVVALILATAAMWMLSDAGLLQDRRATETMS